MRNYCVGLVMIFILCGCAVSYSDSIELIDLSNNQHSYGVYVASINRSINDESLPRSRSNSESVIVLVKTDGREPDFQQYGAIYCIAGPENRFTLVYPSKEKAQIAVDGLNRLESVIYAEIDCEITACDTAQPDEISFYSYGAEETGFRWLLSWARKGGSSKVAIVDSGIVKHPFFSSRLTHGWDYVDNDDDPSNDEYGHGTHVAGIVTDCTRGASVSLYSIRVMDANGKGKASNAANGILEAIEKGIPIINLSFASTSSSAFLDDAVQSAIASGCTVVIAAGNNSIDTSGVWPAHLMDHGAIVVGAANPDGSLASFSNYGDSVDVSFFGSGIESCSNTGGFESRSGTSQATAHISAACALLKTVHNGISPSEMEARIKSAIAKESTCIPYMDRLTPQLIPCHLEALILGLGESISLPIKAFPLVCGEEIKWFSSNTNIFCIDEDGTLTAISSGQADLTGKCVNFDDLQTTVTVTDEASGILCLPTSLKDLKNEALLNVAAPFVTAGDSLQSIGDSAFSPHIVILCSIGSYISEFAESNGLQYIASSH